MPVAVGIMADSYNKPAAGGGDPFTMVAWHAAHWASDPGWTPPADGGLVNTWPDGSGNSRTMSTAGGPVFRVAAATLNNKPGVDFDGVDDRTFSASFSVPQPYAMVAVLRAATTAGDRYALSAGGTTGLFISAGIWKLYAGTAIAGGAADTSHHLVVATVAGASSTVTVDGVQVLTGNVGATAATIWKIAVYGGSNVSFGQYVYGFVGFKAGALTGGESSALLAWSRSFYGTP